VRAVLFALLLTGCTIDVGQPQISIDCIEVVVEPTGEKVQYCDGGRTVVTPPSDAGKDGG